MEKEFLEELNRFLGKAMLATYAGNGSEAARKETGFKELEFADGNWKYLDSYTGSLQSWGRETVWQDGKPVWTQLYGGGMETEYWNAPQFARETTNFLKKALSTGNKTNRFQPRGPKTFSEGEWKYSCNWKGNISRFSGSEQISFKGKKVFGHEFFGGIIKAKENQ